MTDEAESHPEPDLAARLAHLKAFEGELTRKAAALLGRGAVGHTDFFVLGAVRRVLAQTAGFRNLIEAKNFPCAAAILRLQIDTAMRINALRLLDNTDAACDAVMDGQPFNKLKDREGKKLQDAYLREKLAEDHPWVNEVYRQTSDFIHLSGRHFHSAISHTVEETRMAYFMIGAEDPHRPESAYYEIVDTFLRASKMAGVLILGYLTARQMVRQGQGSPPPDSTVPPPQSSS